MGSTGSSLKTSNPLKLEQVERVTKKYINFVTSNCAQDMFFFFFWLISDMEKYSNPIFLALQPLFHVT